MENLFNEVMIKGRWNEVKSQIHKNWDRLTDDELNQTQGDLDQLDALIEKKYGVKSRDVRGKIEEILAGYRRGLEEGHEEAERSGHGPISNIRDQFRQF